MPASQVLMNARSERVIAVLVLLTWFNCPVQKPHCRYWQSQGVTPGGAAGFEPFIVTSPRLGALFWVCPGSGNAVPLTNDGLVALSVAANVLSSMKVSRPRLRPVVPPNWNTSELTPLFAG